MNPSPASLPDETPGLYLHVPFCHEKCRYCGFYSERLRSHDPSSLVAALLAELDRYRDVRSVRTVYIGGGSPTSLPPELLAEIITAIKARWPAPEEFTVECNPGQTDERVVSMLRHHGVDRLSLGVQSFHAKELAFLGRRHSVERAIESVRVAQRLGFDHVSIDLVFAIPGSTLVSWRRCLQSAAALGVQHISAYSLSYEPGTPLEVARRAGQFRTIDEETDRAMYEMAIDFLGSAGFAQYEISNFAQSGYACLHNQGYWQNRPYIGIGPAAGSYWQGRRTVNFADIRQYIQRIEAGSDAYELSAHPDRNERLCETAVLNLRTREGVDLAAFERCTGVDFRRAFEVPLRRHNRGGLIEISDDRVRLTRNALAVADSVLCDFSCL
ncbi:MAG: radical SAM family heme chaperone HemW [Phycisphaerales bacterium]|nr:MAG: radical SAM family heme chaperone HemW [Phycisphaerales bacterium]